MMKAVGVIWKRGFCRGFRGRPCRIRERDRERVAPHSFHYVLISDGATTVPTQSGHQAAPELSGHHRSRIALSSAENVACLAGIMFASKVLLAVRPDSRLPSLAQKSDLAG